MKPPTHTELTMTATSVRCLSNDGTVQLTARAKSVVIAALKRWLDEIKPTLRYRLMLPGQNYSLWYFRTKREGERHRRWLIKNIDLTPKCRVVKFIP